MQKDVLKQILDLYLIRKSAGSPCARARCLDLYLRPPRSIAVAAAPFLFMETVADCSEQITIFAPSVQVFAVLACDRMGDIREILAQLSPSSKSQPSEPMLTYTVELLRSSTTLKCLDGESIVGQCVGWKQECSVGKQMPCRSRRERSSGIDLAQQRSSL